MQPIRLQDIDLVIEIDQSQSEKVQNKKICRKIDGSGSCNLIGRICIPHLKEIKMQIFKNNFCLLLVITRLFILPPVTTLAMFLSRKSSLPSLTPFSYC